MLINYFLFSFKHPKNYVPCNTALTSVTQTDRPPNQHRSLNQHLATDASLDGEVAHLLRHGEGGNFLALLLADGLFAIIFAIILGGRRPGTRVNDGHLVARGADVEGRLHPMELRNVLHKPPGLHVEALRVAVDGPAFGEEAANGTRVRDGASASVHREALALGEPVGSVNN